MAWVNKGSLKGPQGPKGADGTDGTQGPKGDKGDAATITIGNVQTGAAGSSVSVTNSGTSSAAKFNFTIPRGDKGETGAQGPKGETGSQGPQGPKGADGETLQIAGMIFPYAGESAPAGYLMCDGSAVSRTQYPALFSAIGTKYGAGDGSTTFNLPDLIGRFALGAGGGNELAETGGSSTHAHKYKVGARSYYGVGATGNNDPVRAYDYGSKTWVTGTRDTTAPRDLQINTGITRSVTDAGSNPYFQASEANTGTESNLPPYMTVNYIISTGTTPTTTAIGDISLPIPVSQGGTGTSSASQALKNLGVTVSTSAAPSTGTPGTIWIQMV